MHSPGSVVMVFAGVLAILACGTNRTSGDPDGDPVREEVRTIANALADYGTVEDKALSIGGWSYIFTIYERLAFIASPAELFALVRHPSTATRTYAARAILAGHPDALAEVYPLLADPAWVRVVYGCIVRSESVSTLVLEAVCDLPESLARTDFFRKAAGDAALAPPVRDAARSISRGDDVFEVLRVLREHDVIEPAAQEERGRLRQVEHPKSMEWFEEVAATHDYWRMRFYAAAASWSPFMPDWPTPRQAAVFRRLAGDEHPRVRACARALLRTPPGSGPGGGACRWPRPEE